MLLGLSGAFTQSYMIDLLPFLGNPTVKLIFTSIRQISDLIFGNIPIMFAMELPTAWPGAIRESRSSLGHGLSDSADHDEDLVIGNRSADHGGQHCRRRSGHGSGYADAECQRTGGIIAGLVAAWASDKFYNLELPIAFAFFSGKKSVPLISMGVTVVIGLILPFSGSTSSLSAAACRACYCIRFSVGLIWFCQPHDDSIRIASCLECDAALYGGGWNVCD
ncbi:MAG: PTS transporter subunit EIIC [Holdemania massiliensis]